MKKIISFLLFATSLQIFTVPAGFIINRSGQSITVNYKKADGTALFSTGTISLTGSADHATDQMILIPSTTVMNPQTNALYKNGANSADVTVGSVTVTIPSFATNTSYVIAPGATAGTFVANAGLITYDTVTAAATPGAPSPVTAGAGF
ncbi:hypothetical protein KBC04_02865 [Candidatus Babeliales bacterium]|nr:hypothetical protein [Candidatus Babeliales bacterium]MBP9844005.1 hypothetical protein [Candidatus Babeliales bacterium]